MRAPALWTFTCIISTVNCALFLWGQNLGAALGWFVAAWSTFQLISYTRKEPKS